MEPQTAASTEEEILINQRMWVHVDFFIVAVCLVNSCCCLFFLCFLSFMFLMSGLIFPLLWSLLTFYHWSFSCSCTGAQSAVLLYKIVSKWGQRVSHWKLFTGIINGAFFLPLSNLDTLLPGFSPACFKSIVMTTKKRKTLEEHVKTPKIISKKTLQESLEGHKGRRSLFFAH